MPMSLKSKLPLNPPNHPASVIRSFASGGCTSMKNLPLMYLVANPPKLEPGQFLPLALGLLRLLDFIEDDTARLSYPEQSHNCCDNHQETQQPPIRTRQIEDVMVLHAL
jgi:hypothetical protein